jgi:hypothetical protein
VYLSQEEGRKGDEWKGRVEREEGREGGRKSKGT